MSRPHVRVALAVIVASAVLLRVLPWLRLHTFIGVLEYDDGVYYAASRALLRGLLPYRDVTIVHPPLTAVLLLPFAAIGEAWGDPAGMAAARVAVVCVSAVNVLLVHRLASRLSPGRRTPALVAAAVYAVLPDAVAAEHTVLLEPLVNLFCLLAAAALVTASATSRRRAVAAGALLAAGVSVKVFAAVYVVAAVGWLVAVGRRRLLLPLIGGGLAGLAVIDGAFIAAAPHAFWRDVIASQASRPADGGHGLGSRLLDLAGVAVLSRPWAITVAALLAIALVVGLSLGRWSTGTGFWVAVGSLTVAAFLASPSYFRHYGDFLAPALAVLVGRAVAPAIQWRGVRRPARALGGAVCVAGVVAAGAIFVAGTVDSVARWRGQAALQPVGAMIEPGACIYTDSVSLPIAAGVFRLPDAHCPGWLDGRGQALAMGRSWPAASADYARGFLAQQRWQAETLVQIEHADVLLVRSDPTSMAEWSQPLRAYVAAHFDRRWASAGGRVSAELWLRIR